NAKASAVAKELGIVVNDLNAFMKKTGPDKILRPSDGIHLSPEGCEILGGEVARVILKRLSE
ncbi:MAG: lysophospholipase L1-like esterase, partial [Candidatus Binatia bacterium]